MHDDWWIKQAVDRWHYLAVRMRYVHRQLQTLVEEHCDDYPGPVQSQREETEITLSEFERYMGDWASIIADASVWLTR